MGAVPAVQERGDAQRRHLTQAWDVRAVFLKDPASVPKLCRVGAGGQAGKGGKEPHSGHLLWPLPSAVVTGGSTVSLSSVGVNAGQGRRERCGRPMDFVATLLLQPSPSSLFLKLIPCYSLPLPLLCPNLPHKLRRNLSQGFFKPGLHDDSRVFELMGQML